ncbi:MAG: GTP 3',8-cyclase MoaA [Firmicutes bacterium]|nr:GTP 3',8-cyclase MoaA [Bacillota bacterium]
MQDRYHRKINYLRISVTDRCNLRCVYCMPPAGVKSVSHGQILTIEEIAEVVAAGVPAGISKVRLTGGEPLIRRGVLELVAKLRAIPEIDDIALTTNGILLEKMARNLKDAGVDRVNISLDTLKPVRYREVTRGGNLDQVWRGINTALGLGLQLVKINTVVIRGFNDDELEDMARLTMEHPLHVRFIELMPVGTSENWARGRYIPSSEVRELITGALGNLTDENRTLGNGPARYGRLPGALGTVGFISAVSDHFCDRCNRLRLTATGQLRPCLFSHRETDLKGALRSGADREALTRIFQSTVMSKPDRHHLETDRPQHDRVMSQIGG